MPRSLGAAGPPVLHRRLTLVLAVAAAPWPARSAVWQLSQLTPRLCPRDHRGPVTHQMIAAPPRCAARAHGAFRRVRGHHGVPVGPSAALRDFLLHPRKAGLGAGRGVWPRPLRSWCRVVLLLPENKTKEPSRVHLK